MQNAPSENMSPDFVYFISKLPTVKLRAVDRSTIQFWETFGQRSQHISIKFPLHKRSENPWGATNQDFLLPATSLEALHNIKAYL